MKKTIFLKNKQKTVVASALALTMAAPSGIVVNAQQDAGADAVTVYSEADADTDTVSVPDPIKTIDFEDGLQELMNQDPNFNITKSEEVYIKKTLEEVDQYEKVDANGLVYVGSGSDARYYKQSISNQPTTAYDEEKGTVLQLGKSQTIPAIYKAQSASVEDADATVSLDSQLSYTDETAMVSGEGVLVQDEYTANSELVISNPYGSEELAESLVEFSEFDVPANDGKTWKKFRGSRYQPVWEKGLTFSYWINVPVDDNGEYKPSSALRWELLDQEMYQADDYAKYLACKYFDEEKIRMGYTEEDYAVAAKEESKVIYGSEYYFKYLETTGDVDAEGAPIAKLYSGAGFAGPVYDSRYFQNTTGDDWSWYYAFNPNFFRGYIVLADGSYQAQDSSIVSGIDNYYSLYSSLAIEEGSYVRRADVDGELQIDVDNSIYWIADNGQGINKNPNSKMSYGTRASMQSGNSFFMNSWMEGKQQNKLGYGTYQSAGSVALSPVSSISGYNEEDGTYTGIKNGNAGKWHQVTVTLQNDWVEFYVDGVKTDVDCNYSSLGGNSIDTKESFKRLNKGTGLRYGWGAQKGAINFSYGNYVCRLLMDWITDEAATLHIGGVGQEAEDYNQAATSCEFSIDDLKFYGELLTEEQIAVAYDTEVEELNQSADVVGIGIDMNNITDISVGVSDAIATTTEKIEDKEVTALKVAGNEKQSTSTGAKAVNPFVGKELEGATIAYWVKQEDAQRSSAVTFMDEEKYVYNPKSDEGTEAQSILWIENDGTAKFMEGYTNSQFASNLKNSFMTETDVTTEAVLLQESVNDWSYVTVTMTNGGIKYYVDGELIENKAEYQAGVRFLDGYYQRLSDESDIITRYGVYGGIDNQGTTTLMNFITSEDTALYFGSRVLEGGMGWCKTSGATYAGVKTVDMALSEEEVRELYANRFMVEIPISIKSEEPIQSEVPAESEEVLQSETPIESEEVLQSMMPIESEEVLQSEIPAESENPIQSETPGSQQPTDSPESNYLIGDVNCDEMLGLDDSQMILKFALKITRPDDVEMILADLDADGKIFLVDAQRHMKEVVGLDKGILDIDKCTIKEIENLPVMNVQTAVNGEEIQYIISTSEECVMPLMDYGVVYDTDVLEVVKNLDDQYISWGEKILKMAVKIEGAVNHIVMAGVHSNDRFSIAANKEIATITFKVKEGKNLADAEPIMLVPNASVYKGDFSTVADDEDAVFTDVSKLKLEPSESPIISEMPSASPEQIVDQETIVEQIPNEDGTVTNKVTDKVTTVDGTVSEKITETTMGTDGNVTEVVKETVTKPDGTTTITNKSIVTKQDGTIEVEEKITAKDELGLLTTIVNKLIQTAEDIYERLSSTEKQHVDGSLIVKAVTEVSKLDALGSVVKESSITDEKKNAAGTSIEKYEYAADVLPADVEWNTTLIEKLDAADKKIIEDKGAKEYVAYDIVPQSQGNKADVKEGNIKVSLYCGTKWVGKKVKVFDFANNKWLDATVEGEYVSFYVDHFSKYAIAEVVDIKKGDSDLSGKIELNDAQAALKAALNIKPLEGNYKTAADVDGDGKVTLQDAQKILKAALNIIKL